jgi:predicted  nucleic acid-binding Zn-ribbon protein
MEDAQKTVARASQKNRDDEELLQEYQNDLAVAQGAEDQLAPRIRKHEREIQDLEAKIVHKRQQQDLVRDNKEYKALSDEITRLREKIDTEETTVLQLIEKGEKQQKRIADLEAELVAKREEMATRRRELENAVVKAEATQEEMKREIDTCLAQLDNEISVNLSRMSGNLPLPVVWMDKEACGGCHAQFPQQIAIEVSRGRTVVRCQACGRYVVDRP